MRDAMGVMRVEAARRRADACEKMVRGFIMCVVDCPFGGFGKFYRRL